MKKIIYIFILSVMLLALSSCTDTPVDKETIKDTIGDYTIVYPAEYSEWKLEEVEFLKSVIKTVSGKEINAVPDTEAVSGKKIILASSSRISTAFDEEIKEFPNAMCYVVGPDGDNIVLGGQNFYSDMRAIYDFTENCLGYDDLNDIFSDTVHDLDKKKTVIWEKPDFYIMGANFSCAPMTEPWQIKDLADCNFNVVQLNSGMLDFYTEKSLRDTFKYCARFGIEAMYLPQVDSTAKELILPDEDDIIENPAFWGFYIVDEPRTEEQNELYREVLRKAKKKYSGNDRKFYINTGWECDPDSLDRPVQMDYWEEYYRESDALSFDWYQRNFGNRDFCLLYTWEQWAELARKNGQDLYVYIEAYNLKNNGLNTTKLFRTSSYLALCFGAEMIEYFQYGDASPYYTSEGDWSEGSLVDYDFTKNSSYYDAQRCNEEIMNVAKLLEGYEFEGTYTADPKSERLMYIDTLCPDRNNFASVRGNPSKASVVFGCYVNEETGKRALLVMNMDAINDTDYDKDKDSSTLTLKFAKQNVTCYREGKPFEMTATDKEDQFTVPFGNGSAYVFFIE